MVFSTRGNLGRGASWCALATALAAMIGPGAASAQETTTAQDAVPAQDPQEQAGQDIVVTGFRSSLANAIAIKKDESAIVDTILAEDIGKFPDTNLAESMQRVPGVAIARGDGGEGKNVSVRGLGGNFTRVRLNGMEGTSQTGSSDILGAGNRGRSFDFNVFSSEVFSQLSVRKTSSADVEEGSLGATVDLLTSKPLDLRQDFSLSASAQGSYNEVSRKFNPRATLLVSKKFADGKFGVLGSVAYAQRQTREVGYSAVNILSASDDGGFCSPIGFTPRTPADTPAKGSNAANCIAGVPRTSVPSEYNEVFSRLGIPGTPNAATPGRGTFLPRLPRYVNSEQDYDRVGATVSVQWAPSDRTKISLDGLYSLFDVERRDNYILGLSFGRNAGNNGKPMSSIVDAEVKPNGSLIYGRFNGVDVRSEGLVDRFKTTFKQGSLSLEHKFSDSFEITGLVGRNESVFDNPLRFTVNADALNVNGFSYDFRERGNIPVIDYGFDIADPSRFTLLGTAANGDVLGTVTTRRLRTDTKGTTAEFNGLWTVADGYKFRFGAQFRESDFRSASFQRIPTLGQLPPPLPAGTNFSTLSRQITGFGRGLGGGVPSGWAAIDYDKFAAAFDPESRTGQFEECGLECGTVSDNGRIRERVTSGYGQIEFDTVTLLPFRLRGNAGVRYVRTEQLAIGYLPGNAPTGSRFPLIAQQARFDRSYDDWLPSLNLAAEFTDRLILRGAVAQVLSRAELNQLSPGGSINTTARTIATGNPRLEPIRATTYDLSLEYYIGQGGLLSVGYFRKEISSYIQALSTLVRFSDTGLPDGVLAGSPSGPTDLFTLTQQVNTPGGPLDGFEVNYQQPFTFLPGFLRNLGTLLNYTRVKSTINYCLQTSAATGSCVVSTTNDLLGLAKNAASGTLYYEDKRFSLRGTASYRDKFIRAIPSGATDSDVLGNKATLYVDGSASFSLTDQLRVSVEAQNLTDERNTLFIDSAREDPLFETRIGRTVTVGASFRF